MASKTITGTYPGGYALNSTFNVLNVASSAYVGGAGITTSSAQVSTINNAGQVSGEDYGVTLGGNGVLSNTGTISGINPVVGVGTAATVTNDGLIQSNRTVGTFYNYTSYQTAPGIALYDGGTIINRGDVTGGVNVSGGTGTLINEGQIGAPSLTIYNPYFGFQTVKQGPSVVLSAGGRIVNGAQSNTTAEIESGVVVSVGSASITNFGRILSENVPFYPVGFAGWGTGYAIKMQAGGIITNGSEVDTGALIEGFTNGVLITNGTGTVKNFGQIEATYDESHYGGTGRALGLSGGGSVINGSAKDSAARIDGLDYGVLLADGGTVTNFGTIAATRFGSPTTAVWFNSKNSRLIEEGTGVLLGTIVGAGGTLELAGAAGAGTLDGAILDSFGTIQIDKGAHWTLTGVPKLAKKAVLTVAGFLDFAASLVTGGTTSVAKGATLAFDGDVSITTDPVVKAGQFTNAGLVQKTSGTGTSIIRSGTAALVDSGTINVATGTLELTGAAVTVTGAIRGAGTIEFGPGATTLATGTALSTGGLLISGTGTAVTVATSLTYAGTLLATANTELALNSARILTLNGSASFKSDTIDGAGRLVTNGATSVGAVTLGGTAQWYNAGTLTETATLTIGDSAGDKATFLNQSGGEFDLAGNVGIAIGSASRSTFTNQGLLKKTVGATSSVTLALVNTGTVEVASGTLDLQKAVSGNGGTLQIDAGKTLQVDAAVALGQTVTFHHGNDKVILTDALEFAGKLSGFTASDTLDLRQFSAIDSLTFSENAQNTGGILTAKDGVLTANIAMLGQFIASGFVTKTDGSGGTNVTYKPPATPQLVAAHA